MDDIKISLSVPATIYSFGETEKPQTLNQYVTHAKLKLFYVGKTPDNRVFTRQFSDQLLTTLPGTPVVAYYNEAKKDFEGHAPVQYVFGYVPETARIDYMEDGGKTYALTDVLLFTGRPDMIGDIASKIIGKPHSLELDPASIEYEIVRSSGKIESITFKKGAFIGLSVLGTNEKPAFTGSTFFIENSELDTFISSFKEFKHEVESYKSSGGQEMDEKTSIATPEEFQEIEIEIKPKEEELESPEESNTTSDNLENPEEVSCADQAPIILGEDREPGMDPYADVAADPTLAPEIVISQDAPIDANTWEEAVTPEPLTEQPIAEEPPVGPEVEVEVEVEPEKDTEEDDIEEDAGELAISDMPIEHVDIEPASYATEIPAQAEEVPVAVESKEKIDVKQPKKETWEPEKIAHAAALNDAERQELNAYRKEKKFNLIENYSELSEEIKNKFKANHEKFSLEELDKELAFELVKSQRQMKQGGVKMFSVMPTSAGFTSEKDSLKALVDRYKDKK